MGGDVIVHIVNDGKLGGRGVEVWTITDKKMIATTPFRVSTIFIRASAAFILELMLNHEQDHD